MERTLDQWLDYQLRTHPQQIAMGLERVREVYQRLGVPRPGALVLTVGGTNGKGSAIAFALLAPDFVMSRPGNLPSATGARRAVLLGRSTPVF